MMYLGTLLARQMCIHLTRQPFSLPLAVCRGAATPGEAAREQEELGSQGAREEQETSGGAEDGVCLDSLQASHSALQYNQHNNTSHTFHFCC